MPPNMIFPHAIPPRIGAICTVKFSGPSLQVIVNDSSLFLNRTGPGAVKSQLPFLFVAVHGIASEQLVI